MSGINAEIFAAPCVAYMHRMLFKMIEGHVDMHKFTLRTDAAGVCATTWEARWNVVFARYQPCDAELCRR